MQQTINLGPEYQSDMLQALFDALTAEGAQTIDQRSGPAGSQEISHWKFQLERGLIEVDAGTYLGISVSGPIELVARVTRIIQEKILSAFPKEN